MYTLHAQMASLRCDSLGCSRTDLRSRDGVKTAGLHRVVVWAVCEKQMIRWCVSQAHVLHTQHARSWARTHRHTVTPHPSPDLGVRS